MWTSLKRGPLADLSTPKVQKPGDQGQKNLAPVVQTLDSAIHRIKIYPLDNAIGFPNTYPLDSDI